MSDSTPETQPDGAFTPPPRNPPTALATATPEPPYRPLPTLRTPRSFGSVVNDMLDGLDSIADRIAHGVGLR